MGLLRYLIVQLAAIVGKLVIEKLDNMKMIKHYGGLRQIFRNCCTIRG